MSDKKTITKVVSFLPFDIEYEEEYLREMEGRGLKFSSRSGVLYKFNKAEDVKPQKGVRYVIETSKKRSYSEEEMREKHDADWELICQGPQKCNYWRTNNSKVHNFPEKRITTLKNALRNTFTLIFPVLLLIPAVLGILNHFKGIKLLTMPILGGVSYVALWIMFFILAAFTLLGSIKLILKINSLKSLNYFRRPDAGDRFWESESESKGWRLAKLRGFLYMLITVVCLLFSIIINFWNYYDEVYLAEDEKSAMPTMHIAALSDFSPSLQEYFFKGIIHEPTEYDISSDEAETEAEGVEAEKGVPEEDAESGNGEQGNDSGHKEDAEKPPEEGTYRDSYYMTKNSNSTIVMTDFEEYELFAPKGEYRAYYGKFRGKQFMEVFGELTINSIIESIGYENYDLKNVTEKFSGYDYVGYFRGGFEDEKTLLLVLKKDEKFSIYAMKAYIEGDFYKQVYDKEGLDFINQFKVIDDKLKGR